MNLLIDVSYIAKKNVWIRSTGESYLSSKEDREDMIQSLMISINTIYHRYNMVDRIILCFDSVKKSWRFDLQYKDLYKSNRHRKSSNRYDPMGYRKMMIEFHEWCLSNGYCSMMYDRAEGDDLLYIASNLLLNAGFSSMICTADKDMQQLVTNKGKDYIYIFNNDTSKTQTHYIEEIKQTSTSETTFENFFDEDREAQNKSIIYDRCTKIVPQNSLFLKVLAGDKSDCIPSCYTYQKGKQMVGFTELRATSVFDKYYKERFLSDGLTMQKIFSDETLLNELALNVVKEVKKEWSDDDITSCIAGLKTNLTYIWLNVSCYPSDYYDELENYVINQLSNYGRSDDFSQYIKKD